MNNQTQQKIEKFHEMVGFDVCYRFEQEVASAVIRLAESIQKNFLDNETKVNYTTHVFAKMLDDLADMLDRSHFLN